MQTRKVEHTTPIRLTAWLEEAFPGVQKFAVTRALRQKDFRINGRRTGADELLQPGDDVSVYIDDSLLLPPVETLWLSEELIIAVKPQGILSVGAGSMEERVSRWLGSRGEPSTAIACHRLDSGTGGLLMLARSAEAEAAVRAMMEAGKITKTYHCIVKGVPEPAQATVTAYLVKDKDRSLVTVYDSPRPGARTAVTQYAIIATDISRSLLQVTLHTGRTHQIRAHMAHLGYPILGDDKYGDRGFNRLYKARRQKLWASGLAFEFTPEECPQLSELAGRSVLFHAPFLDEF